MVSKRKFEWCARTGCNNPKNGSLKASDYEVAKRTAKYIAYDKTCRHCRKTYTRKTPDKLKPGECYNRTKCVNPRNGSLLPEDFPIAVGWKDKRLSTCKLCSEQRKRTTYDIEDVINSSLVQQWLCGRIGGKSCQNHM